MYKLNRRNTLKQHGVLHTPEIFLTKSLTEMVQVGESHAVTQAEPGESHQAKPHPLVTKSTFFS